MKELTISDLYDILIDNIKIIVISVIVGVILAVIYTTVIITPMYESSTKIILAKPAGFLSETTGQTTTGELTTSDVTLNQKLVSTYSEIIKSRKVLNEVIDNLNLNATAASIAKNITVSPVQDSEVINITVAYQDPTTASNIANEVINTFEKQVKEIYNIENVNQVDIAEPNLTPNNISLPKNIALFAIISFMLSYGIYFMIEYFKTTLKTPNDIEDEIGLSLLAIVPDLNKKGEE